MEQHTLDGPENSVQMITLNWYTLVSNVQTSLMFKIIAIKRHFLQ